MINPTAGNRSINLIRLRRSGKLLIALSIIVLTNILVLGTLMLSQIQSLRRNVEVTESIINANIRTIGQTQRELLRLKLALVDGSDNDTVSLYSAFASQRINELTLTYNEATLGAEDLFIRADELAIQWETDATPLIQDILEYDNDDDANIREELIILLDVLELEYNNLASHGEFNRKVQAGAANNAAKTFVRNAGYILFGLGLTVMGYLAFLVVAGIDYLKFDRQRELTNRELSKQQTRLRSLLEVASQSIDIDSQIDQIIEQGCKSLGMQVGIVSRVYSDGYTIINCYAPDHAISQGMSCNLNATLCKQTITSATLLSVPDIPSIMQITNPCFDAIMPGSYIGIPLTVNSRIYGTLSFVSEEIQETPFSENDQDFVRLMAQWINVSLERQHARNELSSYATSLEKSNTELQQFAYAASHDLQEPLRKIQTFGSRIEAKYSDKLDQRGNEYLTRMLGAAGRMQILIQDLLALSRVTTQANPLEDTDLNEIIDGVLSDLEVQIEQSKAEIVVETLPIIKVDATQMRQLFQNLITNAIKFTQEGTSPEIFIESRLLTARTVPEIEISIRDNGIGFEQQYAERIFSVFQRLHGRGDYEGTGVGLALCRKIVERHNGTIIANGKSGEGAVFIVTLPIEHLQEEK